MNRRSSRRSGPLVLVGVVALALGVFAFACGSENGELPSCDGAACEDGGDSEGSTQDGAPDQDGNIPADGGTDGDADSSAVVSCGDAGEPGTLDPAFGDGGIVWLDFAGGAARDVVVQPDGKIVLVGATAPAGEHFAIVRLMPNGALDQTFGASGVVERRGGTVTHLLSGVGLQADGKIVATGQVRSTGQPSRIVVARHLGDGGADPAFGDAGLVLTPYPGRDAYGRSLVLEPGGKILVGGYSEDALDPQGTGDYEVLRFNADGSLDATFGSGGRVTVDVHGTSDGPGVAASSVGGKLVVAGGSVQTVANNVSAARLNADGARDTSFGDAGQFLSTGTGTAFGLTVDGAGRTLLVGSTGSDFLTIRLSASGSPDPSFGGTGTVTTDFSGRGDEAAAVLVQPDGRVVVVGQGNGGGGTPDTALQLVRLLPNGDLDPTFGSGGRVVTLPPANAYYGASGATLDACSIIVVGGWASGAGLMKNAMGVARYRR